MKSRIKKRKTGSFFSLLAKNQIIFTIAFLLVALTIYAITTLRTASLIFVPQYAQLSEEMENFQTENYAKIPLLKYLGKKYEMLIFDQEGSSIFSTSKSEEFFLSLEELDTIPDITDTSSYTILRYRTADGIQQVLIRYEEGTSDTRETNEYPDAYATLNEDLAVTEGNLFPVGQTLTEMKLNLLMGKYTNYYEIRKMKFHTVSGQPRCAVFMVPSMSDKQYDSIFNLWDAGWMAFILAYILIVLYSMHRLNRRTKLLLNPLNTAILDYINKKNTNLENYSGPNEFVEIADNFSALAEKLNASENDRDQLDKARQKILADISHDLKTPITVIQGYSHAVKDGLVPENERERYLNTICKKADTLSELIDAFSEYNRLEHPDFILKKERLDICEFCKELLADKYQELDLAGYFMEVDIPEDIVYYDFDRSHLKRVFDNMIGNSIKYNPPGTSLYFTLCDKEKEIQIMLGDNGVGIREEIAETIFDPFVVGDEARSSKQGTGLGLAIVREIIERHGGKICLIQPPRYPYHVQFLIRLPKTK